MSFVHLHNHSHYSLLDGAQNIKTMVAKAKELDMPAIALTDHGNMFGAIEFYQNCKKNDIKPILGMEAYIVGQGDHRDRKKPNGIENKTYHLVLLCKNEEGYKNLCKLSSIAYKDGFYYKPRIDKNLLRKYSSGLIGLTACLGGEVTNAHLRGDDDYARQAALEYKDIFDEGDFYLEVQNHGMDEDRAYEKNYQLAKELGIKSVATNDVHYTEKEHWESHDVLICMQGGKSRNDEKRMRYEQEEFYMRSPEEMRQLYPDRQELCDVTLEIAEKCNVEFKFNDYKLPVFPIPEEEGDITANEYLRIKAERGLKARYSEITDELTERLNYELGVIENMGFSAYFLITMDFIEAARNMDIPVGLGRGSAAGSIVAFATGITSVDPIKYNLLFERFLNPERISMPDVDIDFCMRRRDEVIDYVRKKYGENNVCQIITFGTMASKNAIKDVARVLDIPFDKSNQITKLIPVNQGKPMSITESQEKIDEIKSLLDNDDPVYKELFKHAGVLEGVAKSTGIHAAGVIIAPDDVSNIAPVYKNSDGVITTQYSMSYAESIGLLKMDFLGLRTLTVIYDAVKMIRALSPELENFDIETIPMDDAKTYDVYGAGDTVGVFQFESAGMQKALRNLKPNRIEDLIAMNALYRPGPMDNIGSFIDRKHGREKVDYLHPMLEPILNETYGIIVYQEQVMKIVSDLGGFTLAEADLVRRAMGKKKIDIMNEKKIQFVQQAKEINKIDEATSIQIYDLIVAFASYGFNKSHAAAYSILSYQTAYLKAHYPAQFMASIMSSEINSPDRIVIYMEECKRLGIEVIPPDVNISFPDFSAPNNNTIAFGMHAIKNVGMIAIESIVATREKRGEKFKNLFDLIEHVDSRVVNKKVLESLIEAGAMDTLEGNRAQNYASVDLAAEFSTKLNQSKTDANQVSIFGESNDVIKVSYPVLPDIPDWSSTEKLNREKSLLGFYISGHPLTKYTQTLNMINTINRSNFEAKPTTVKGKLGGLITSVKNIITKKGAKMAFVAVENFDFSFEVPVFPRTYEKFNELLEVGKMCIFYGKLTYTDAKDIKIAADDIFPLENAQTAQVDKVIINLPMSRITNQIVKDLHFFLESEIGDSDVFLKVKLEDGKNLKLKSKKYRINGNMETINKLKTIVGDQNLAYN